VIVSDPELASQRLRPVGSVLEGRFQERERMYEVG
jgi:hypothetical protein